MRAVLQEMAMELPQISDVFSDCASLANKKNLELLDDARKVNEQQKVRTESLIDDLELAEEFVSEKYVEAPTGKDKKEGQIRDLLHRVMNSLREQH